MGFKGKRLAHAREALNLTQDQLGAIVGRTITTISNWERGATVPAPRMQIVLATALGCDTSFFYSGKRRAG